jgi:hypothetical protein
MPPRWPGGDIPTVVLAGSAGTSHSTKGIQMEKVTKTAAREGKNFMDIQWHKALSLVSPGLASLVLAASPSFATSPSNAQIYGQISASGTLAAGSLGITTVTHPANGHYCIEPASGPLRTAVSNGTLGVQLTQQSPNWPYTPAWIAQILEPHNGNGCPNTQYIAVSIESLFSGPAPTVTSASAGHYPSGTNGVNSDFTILFD